MAQARAEVSTGGLATGRRALTPWRMNDPRDLGRFVEAFLRHPVLGPRLFAAASPAGSVFQEILDRYFGGVPDNETLRLMKASADDRQQ